MDMIFRINEKDLPTSLTTTYAFKPDMQKLSDYAKEHPEICSIAKR
jgi:hypothetical protein